MHLSNFPSAQAVSVERPLSVAVTGRLWRLMGHCLHKERGRGHPLCVYFHVDYINCGNSSLCASKVVSLQRVTENVSGVEKTEIKCVYVCVCTSACVCLCVCVWWMSDSGSRRVESPIESSAPRWSVCSHWGIPWHCSSLPKWKKATAAPLSSDSLSTWQQIRLSTIWCMHIKKYLSNENWIWCQCTVRWQIFHNDQ